MIAEALQYLKEQFKENTIVVGEKTFSSERFNEVKPDRKEILGARPALVKVCTLKGLADLITGRLDGAVRDQVEDWPPYPRFDYLDAIIQVENETTVAVYARATDIDGKRARLIEASPVLFEKFPFGKWMSQEEFVIAVAARFAQTEDKDYVLRIASALTAEEATVSEDDGFSQKVTAKAGMRVPETVKLKNLVELAPYRTFPEIPQVVSKFVFRAKPGEQPQLMLMEADGGAWKIGAIQKIREVVAGYSLGIDIVA